MSMEGIWENKIEGLATSGNLSFQ